MTGSLKRTGRIVSRISHPWYVMILLAVTSDGKMPLVFLRQGAKVACANYTFDVLKKEEGSHLGNRQWTYPQDSSSVHMTTVGSHDGAKMVHKNFPDLIFVSKWPPNSPVLSPRSTIQSGMRIKKQSTILFTTPSSGIIKKKKHARR